MQNNTRRNPYFLAALLVVGAGCGGDGEVEKPGEGNEEEVINKVTLDFVAMPSSPGDRVSAVWNDADGEGGDDPSVEDIELENGKQYTLSIKFENTLESTVENIRDEIEEEAEEHQIFILGSAITSPATGTNDRAIATLAYHDKESDYVDNEGDDLPVGLSHTVEATAVGRSTFRVILRHLPPVNATAVKTSGLAAKVAESGIADIAGSSDVDIRFDLAVVASFLSARARP